MRRVSTAGLLGGAIALCLSMAACSVENEAERQGLQSAGGLTAGAAAAAEAARPTATGSRNQTQAAGAEPSQTPVIVFLGTSLTAGYGLEEDQAFPALIQQKLDRAGLDYRVVNAGVSGDTSAGGRRRLAWLLRLPISVLVLELGANDMLRGQRVDQLRSNLIAILDQTRAAHPDVRFVIAGMRAAPNLGRDYGDAFDAVYPAFARRYDAAFIPFLLQDVAARRNLNQADGIHPTAEGHALIADRVWEKLRPVLE
jgi:acyl-CoA thioesterase-1